MKWKSKAVWIVGTYYLSLLSGVVLGQTASGVASQQPQYFPKTKVDDFRATWYGSALHAMKEPSLLVTASGPQDPASFRFLWLRTFDHPVAVRLAINKDGSGVVLLKVTSGAGGYKPGQITQEQTFSASKSQVQNFRTLLESVGFWSLKNESVAGLDGAEWIMEGRENGRYQVVDRWGPNPEDAYRKMCWFLIGLTNLKIDPKKVY